MTTNKTYTLINNNIIPYENINFTYIDNKKYFSARELNIMLEDLINVLKLKRGLFHSPINIKKNVVIEGQKLILVPFEYVIDILNKFKSMLDEKNIEDKELRKQITNEIIEHFTNLK